MKALIPFFRKTTSVRAWPLALLLAALTLYTGCDSSPGIDDDGGETLALRVTTVTQGYDPDEDGYMVMIDGVQEVAIGANATVSVPNLAAGAHQIRLGGVSTNCAVAGPSTVQEGEESVNFIITCVLKGRIFYGCDTGIPVLGSNLCSMRPNGTEVVELVHDGQVGSIAVSPDGTKVIFSREGTLHIIDADGGNMVLFTPNVGLQEAYAPSWSRDGAKVAFSARPSGVNSGVPTGTNDIFMADADGSNAVNLTHSDSLWYRGPSWSPDGSQLAFTAFTEPDDDTIDDEWGNIYVMNADGTNLRNITAGTPVAGLVGHENIYVSWSPVDSRIVFTAAPSADLRYEVSSVYMIDASGANLVRLTGEDEQGAYPSWRPDGEWLIYASGCDQGSTLAIMRPDGSDRQFIPDCAMVEQSPSWALGEGQ